MAQAQQEARFAEVTPVMVAKRDSQIAISIQAGGVEANIHNGADSATVESVLRILKYKLDPYRYLLWVLRSAPVLSQSDKSWGENLLPANAPQECLVPQ